MRTPKESGLIALASASERSQIIPRVRSSAWAQWAAGGREAGAAETDLRRSEKSAEEGLCLGQSRCFASPKEIEQFVMGSN